MRRFTRIFAFWLILACLIPGFASAQEYQVQDAASVRLDAMDLLDICAFSAEYNSDDRNYLIRWENPLQVYVGGDPSGADIEFMEQFFTQLQLRVPLFPGISFTSDKEASNVQFYFVPLDKMDDYITNYTEGNWGYVTYWWSNYRMSGIEIGIATDVTTQKERNHLIMEEFINGSGISNDHYVYSDSITYQEWTTVQSPSELDWAMLNLIYSDFAYAGMDKDEFFDACYDYIYYR